MSDTDSQHTIVEQLSVHLEFLGYKVSRPSEADVWFLAEHPRRLDLFFRTSSDFLRLHSNFHLGKCPDNSLRQEALRQLNDLNERTQLAKYALTTSTKADGYDTIRVRANLPLAYDRSLFGSMLDTWQRECEMVWQIDRYPEPEQTATETPAVDQKQTEGWAKDQKES
jgi:hypothetical protein